MTGIVQREDIRMLKARKHTNFTYEAELARLGCGIGVQNLEGHLSFVPRVRRQIDSGEGALPDLPLDFVAASKRGSKRRNRVMRSERGRHSVPSLRTRTGYRLAALAWRELQGIPMTPLTGLGKHKSPKRIEPERRSRFTRRSSTRSGC